MTPTPAEVLKEVKEAATAFLSSAITLSDDYLDVFSTYRDDETVQGWEIGRWRKLAKDRKAFVAALASLRGLKVTEGWANRGDDRPLRFYPAITPTQMPPRRDLVPAVLLTAPEEERK